MINIKYYGDYTHNVLLPLARVLITTVIGKVSLSSAGRRLTSTLQVPFCGIAGPKPKTYSYVGG